MAKQVVLDGDKNSELKVEIVKMSRSEKSQLQIEHKKTKKFCSFPSRTHGFSSVVFNYCVCGQIWFGYPQKSVNFNLAQTFLVTDRKKSETKLLWHRGGTITRG